MFFNLYLGLVVAQSGVKALTERVFNMSKFNDSIFIPCYITSKIFILSK